MTYRGNTSDRTRAAIKVLTHPRCISPSPLGSPLFPGDEVALEKGGVDEVALEKGGVDEDSLGNSREQLTSSSYSFHPGVAMLISTPLGSSTAQRLLPPTQPSGRVQVRLRSCRNWHHLERNRDRLKKVFVLIDYDYLILMYNESLLLSQGPRKIRSDYYQ